ncbi:MAG: hypothetical protein JXA94_03300 [Parachlamydiales bacterium]|nr:hypothetical protein [Parachlamydiales bacterium]
MHKFLSFLIFLFVFSNGYTLEKQPWFGDVYEFHFLSKYTFFRFSKVDSALIQPDNAFNDHLLHFNLSFAPTLQWSIDSDLEFIGTPRQDFGFRTVAFQARYLFKDDIIGDPVSFAMGGNFRVVSSDSLKDVSTLYHSDIDFEMNFALGKEFSHQDYWRFRIWGYAAAGIANKGSPWIRAKLSIEGNSKEERQWGLFAEAMRGYGRREYVDVYNFDGYAKIRQSNIDLGFSYGFLLGVWGTFSLEYKRTVLAKRSPQDVNFFSVIYLLPFSF